MSEKQALNSHWGLSPSELPHSINRPPNDTRRNDWKRRLLQSILLLAITTYFLLRNPWLHSSRHLVPFDPTLKARCESLLNTPPGSYYSERLDRLVSTLKVDPAGGPNGGGATWIAEPGPSAEYYLGGFSRADWFLSERPLLIVVQHTGKVSILSPEFEALRAQGISRSDGVEVDWIIWAEDQSPYEILGDALGPGALNTLVIDGQVRNFIVEGLRAQSSGPESAVRTVELGKKVSLLRERKDSREVGLLRCANQMTLHAIRQTRRRMYISISETRTRKILDQELAKTGLDGEGGLVLFGGDAALPHGSGTERTLGKEDFVLIDVGGTWGGYTADITRTFALPHSKIPKKHITAWETVRQAQHAPYALLLSSNTTSPPHFGDLDKAARDVIASKYSAPGFEIFTHRLGHGIGLEGHESPYLVPGARAIPRSGHVFSLEPGIYVPKGSRSKSTLVDGDKDELALDDIGVRLEDCFVVTEDEDGNLGGEWLTGPVEQWGEI